MTDISDSSLQATFSLKKKLDVLFMTLMGLALLTLSLSQPLINNMRYCDGFCAGVTETKNSDIYYFVRASTPFTDDCKCNFVKRDMQ